MNQRSAILRLGGQAILDCTAELARRVKATGNPCCGRWCDACPFDYAGSGTRSCARWHGEGRLRFCIYEHLQSPMDWRHLHAMRRCVVGLCTETN